MIYVVEQSKDPEMYEFWSMYKKADGKVIPMLCWIAHGDTLDSSVVSAIEEAGEVEVFLEFAK